MAQNSILDWKDDGVIVAVTTVIVAVLVVVVVVTCFSACYYKVHND